MKNIGKSFIGAVTLFGVCFVVLIAYASLLGENNKIDSVVDNFFQNMRGQRYFSIEDNQNVVKSFDVFDIDGEYSENCLFLELALLEKYNISDAFDYKIETEKSHFWIPFTNNSKIHIDVYLEKPADSNIFSIFKKSQRPEFVKNLFTVERKDGRWLIAAINIQDSSLFESFNRIKDDLNIDSYVSFSGTSLTVKPIEIDTKNITNIERRKLNFIFQKLSQLIESAGHPIEKP